MPWNALPGQKEQLVDGGQWRPADRPERPEHTDTLEAVTR
jgi:hypothetical protein